MKSSAKLWLVVAPAPFFAMGAFQSYAKSNVVKTRILEREVHRDQTYLIRDARLLLGDGTVIEQGSVLIKHGKIAEIYTGAAPDAKALKAEPIDAAGKTLLPGLIDVHAHLAPLAGIRKTPSNTKKSTTRSIASWPPTSIAASLP